MITIDLPGSKSISNRLLMIKAIGALNFDIVNCSDAEDTLLLKKALLDIQEGKEIIDIHHAGTNMRFLCAYLSALNNKTTILTGSDRMKQRPIGSLVNALRSIGANIEYTEKDGYPPIRIKGKELSAEHIEISADVSSQFVSALLMIAPLLKSDLTIHLKGETVSKGYITMTLALMNEFGIKHTWNGSDIKVLAGNYSWNKPSIINECDWSAASYFYSALLLSKHTQIRLKGLYRNSIQPDSVLADLFTSFGIDTVYEEKGITLYKTNKEIKAFEYDFSACPDIAQTLAALCAAKRIPFTLNGLKTLKIKETDRILALQQELTKIGAHVTTSHESIRITHYDLVDVNATITISTYNDHRMAMSFAPLQLLYPNMVIEDMPVVKKSFPNFFDQMNKLSAL